MVFNLAIIIVFIGVAGVLCALFNSLGEEHGLLKGALFFVIMFILLMGLNTSNNIAELNEAGSSIIGMIDTSYTILLYLIFLSFGYFILFTIVSISQKKKFERENRE